MAESIIQVDEKDNPIGPVDRYLAHTNDGVLHRGFMIVVKNYANQIYTARRAGKRPDLKNFPAPFPYQWDVSIAGHPRWPVDDSRTQMCRELNEELGLKVTENDVKIIGNFFYNSVDPACPTKKYNMKVREYEICEVAVVYTNQEPKPSPAENDAGEWLDINEVKKQVAAFADKNIVTMPNGRIDIKNFTLEERMFTPWAVKAHQFYPQIYSKRK